MRITGDFCPRYGSKFLKRKGKKMGNTKNSEFFSNEKLEKAIETYNLYITNKEAFKKVYNEEYEYDENKSFLENAKDEINFFTAKAKIEATVPDAIMLATYIFEKAVCPILKDRKIEITEISVIPTYGDDSFPELDLRIENEASQVTLFLDSESFRIGGAIVEQEGKKKEIYKKIPCEGFIADKELTEGFVISKNKFEFSSNAQLSLDYLNKKIIPQIENDCRKLIDRAFP